MHDIFRLMKGKNLPPRIFYPERLSFRIKEGKKSFSDKQNLKVFLTTKPSLQKKLKGIVSVEREDHQWEYENEKEKNKTKQKHKSSKNMYFCIRMVKGFLPYPPLPKGCKIWHHTPKTLQGRGVKKEFEFKWQST